MSDEITVSVKSNEHGFKDAKKVAADVGGAMLDNGWMLRKARAHNAEGGREIEMDFFKSEDMKSGAADD